MEAGREILLLDWKYSAWATRRLLDACARLTIEERTRDLGMPHGSVLSTLDHMYRSEEFWAGCLVANEMPPMDEIGETEPQAPRELETLERLWPTVWEQVDQWLSSLSEEELNETLTSRIAAGRDFEFTRWQLILHSVNHSTLHRGQIAGMLRMMGKRSPNVDIMGYYLRS